MAWDRHSIGLMQRGAISRRAGFRVDSTSNDGQRLSRDEGSHDGGAFPHDRVLDDRRLQGGGSAYGRRVSRGGGAGREHNPGRTNHIDGVNRKSWPKHGDVRSSHKTPLHGEAWEAKYAPRSLARKWSSSEYYPNEDGTLRGDPGYRQR